MNDVHSRLNRTVVARVERPESAEELAACITRARAEGLPVAVCGARHAMGGQQFARAGVLIDTTALTRVLGFDGQRGLIRVEAGIDWPSLMRWYLERQGEGAEWGFAQKQTGADHLTIGGSVSANAHGRGLALPPMVGQIESLEVIDARGCLLECSRRVNADLFRLVVGGYGLLGAISSVTLRLAPRTRLRRMVEIADVSDAVPALEGAATGGALYGDFQYAIDPADDAAFLRRGVLAWYEPAGDGGRCGEAGADLSRRDWLRLLELAHTDKARAFDLYAEHYLGTRGRLYWSDEHQLSTYLPDYAEFLRQRLRPRYPESLMISELFVPRGALGAFMAGARGVLRATGAEVIYGTVRLVEPDTETVLSWARGRSAGVIFNLRTPHTARGIERAAAAFRALIDAALGLGGTYYPTYHRWATREQVLACHPRLPEFLRLKREHDPGELFRSDWYAHHKRLLGVGRAAHA